jgi:hypothetical protein
MLYPIYNDCKKRLFQFGYSDFKYDDKKRLFKEYPDSFITIMVFNRSSEIERHLIIDPERIVDISNHDDGNACRAHFDDSTENPMIFVFSRDKEGYRELEKYYKKHNRYDMLLKMR